jgi:hypothetical protein
LVSIQLQQQEEQQLKEMNGRKVKEEINPGNHEMGCLLSIQLQQQEKQQLKDNERRNHEMGWLLCIQLQQQDK